MTEEYHDNIYSVFGHCEWVLNQIFGSQLLTLSGSSSRYLAAILICSAKNNIYINKL